MPTMMTRTFAVALVALCPVPAGAIDSTHPTPRAKGVELDGRAKIAIPVGGIDARTVVAVPANSDFVQKSVAQGLEEDGVPPVLAAKLAEHPDFVGGCQLCEQTRKAFREYGMRAAAPAPKAGYGLPDDLARRLASADAEVRRAALRDVIDRYVERGYTRAELKADEKAALTKVVKNMRLRPKDPNAPLPNGLKFCPSCDGACRVRPATTP